MTAGTPTCLACGATLHQGDQFCRSCGRDLSPSEIALTAATPTAATPTPGPSPAREPAMAATPPSPVPDLKLPIVMPTAPPVLGPTRTPERPRPASGSAASPTGSGCRDRLARLASGIGQGALGCLTVFVLLGIASGVIRAIVGPGDSPGPSLRATATAPTPGPTRVVITAPPAATPEPTARELTLAEAVAGGLVDVAAEGRNLQVLDLTLTSLVDEALTVVVPAGLLFGSDAGDTQSMVVIYPESIDLAPGEELSWPINVACAAMHLDQPEVGDTFQVATASAVVVSLVTSEAFAAADFRVQQFAIWTLTDNPTRSGYVELGSFGVGSGPSSSELAEIRTMFGAAGIDASKYRALR